MISTKNVANAVGGKTARACDSCVRKRARWYCAADDAFLCQACDSSVHSANSLARRHERVRLKSASCKPPPPEDHSNSAPSWHKGFTRKARTPRPGKPAGRRPKSDDSSSLLPSTFFSLVPEADDTTSHEENEEDQLLYRVPTFDPFVEDKEAKVVDSENLHGFLPSDMDLAEFAADVESLLGKNLENECFDMEGLGLLDCEEKDVDAAEAKGCSLGRGRVKVEEEEEACHHQQFDAEIDLMREPFELNFEDYDDDAPGSCCEEDEKMGVGVAAAAGQMGVKNEGGEFVDESKTKKKKKAVLSLDCDAVIAAWGNDRSPWTTGERPDFDPDDCWPNCMVTCGVNYRFSCGDFGVIGGHTAAMAAGGREARVSRYREKRRTRLFSKKIRYEVRKLNAEKRPRMKGRFVKRTPFAPPTLPILSIK